MTSSLNQLDAQLSGSRWARCEPPRSPPSSLRAWLSFETTLGLQRGLEALSPLCLAPELNQALLQVIYRPELLSLSVARLHSQFQAAHPRCSTYLPLCLPLPQTEALRRWASPEDCGACIFLEGGRCDGLGPRQAASTARGAELSGAGLVAPITERLGRVWPALAQDLPATMVRVRRAPPSSSTAPAGLVGPLGGPPRLGGGGARQPPCSGTSRGSPGRRRGKGGPGLALKGTV